MEMELISEDSENNQRLGRNGIKTLPNRLWIITRSVSGLARKPEFGMEHRRLSRKMESYDYTHLSCSTARRGSIPQDVRWANGS